MIETHAPSSFAAIVVAAGKGLRAGGDLPKQFRQWRGKMLVRHSVDALLAAGAHPLIVVIPAVEEAIPEELQRELADVRFVTGGETRQDSVRNGLEALSTHAPQSVLIHDAARPDLPSAVIQRLMQSLSSFSGSIPTLPIVDSLAVVGSDRTMNGTADRDALARVQTPQAFRFRDILHAHRSWKGPTTAGDDAQVLAASGGSVGLVEGDERLKKITFAEDLMEIGTCAEFRVGQGYDVHRLVDREELWLCGVKLEHTKGLSGHSDADVALHAITDAVLGAIGDGDIGTHFPPSDPQWAGAPSGQFLAHAVDLARQAGFAVGNIDLTLICEAPKIGPHRAAMRAEVSRLVQVDERSVSIKATTTERLGFAGREEGIAAQAIVLLRSI